MSKVITLKHPITFGEREVTELTLKRLKAKQMRNLPVPSPGTRMTFGDLMDLAAKSSGELPALIGELDGEDLMEVVGEVGSFLGDSQTTGESA